MCKAALFQTGQRFRRLLQRLVIEAHHRFEQQPTGNVNVINTAPCGHNASCVYNTFPGQLSQTATSCSTGAGAVLGLPQRGVIQVGGIFSGTFWYLPDSPPVESVTEKITYSLP
jgi:hypothetical protein